MTTKNHSQKISQSEVKIRDGKPTDAEFILNSWAASYRNNVVFGAIPKDTYFKFYREFTVSILERSQAFMACNPENEDQLFGYIIYRFKGDLPIVSYLYVKQAFRRFGIGRILLDSVSPTAKMITHIMPKYEQWLKNQSCVFNPFLELEEFYEVRRR
jgi:GNAT superfamily N-acetyltransferase